MRRSLAARALLWFWAILLVAAAGGGATLQWLGPPGQTKPAAAPSGHTATDQPGAPASPTPAPSQAPEATAAPAPAPGPAAPNPVVAPNPAGADSLPLGIGGSTPGPIAAPDLALQEPSVSFPGSSLPRIAADGRRPMQVYARGFDAADRRPRIGLLLSGVGLSLAASKDALRLLPGPITLAISPYALHPDELLQGARDAGHEFLISLPMEPQGFPLNSEGPHAMLTGARPEDNRLQLQWALSRIDGYAGATSALDGMRGERFAGLGAVFDPVLRELASRGLFYVDARPGQPAPALAFGRSVDLVVDEPAVRAEIDAKLARLEAIAHERGSALGLAGSVRPVTVAAIAAWANSLDAHGLALAPASALVHPPAAPAKQP